MIQNNEPILPREGFVRLPVILQVLGVKKSFFWEQVQAGRFPKPIKMGQRISVWRVEDVRQLISHISSQQSGKFGL